MVGLDAAGKTTILYKLKLGEIVTTIPTIGELVLVLLGCCLKLGHRQKGCDLCVGGPTARAALQGGKGGRGGGLSTSQKRASGA